MKSRCALCFGLACFVTVAGLEKTSMGADPCPCPPLIQTPPAEGNACPPGTAAPMTPGNANPPSAPMPPGPPSAESQRPVIAPTPAESAMPAEDFSGLGSGRNAYEQSNFSVAGTGLASPGITAGSIPQGFSDSNTTILPGLLSAATSQSPIVMDRVFFNYALYDQFQVTQSIVHFDPGNPTTATTSTRQLAGFNLNQFDFGVEKSLFGGRASVYIDTPVLYAADNVTNQSINGFGDLSFGFKLLLLSNPQTGDALSAGLTVAVPTAHPGQFFNAVLVNNPTPPPPEKTELFTTSVNPTYVQPWVAGVFNYHGFFVQEYCAFIQPLPDTVSSSINNCLSAGYRLYTADPCCQSNHWITSVTPILGSQTLVALQHGFNDSSVSQNINPPTVDIGAFRISFPTQVFLTEGCQFGVGQRASVFAGVVEPVAGPEAFKIGATVGINFYF